MENQCYGTKRLVKAVKRKNTLSNVLIAFKELLNLVPAVISVKLIEAAFLGTLELQSILLAAAVMTAALFFKAVFAGAAAHIAHSAAYGSLTELRLEIVKHLKKLPLGYFKTKQTGELINIMEHDVEQVEFYLAHALPEIMSATVVPAIIFALVLYINVRLAFVLVSTVPLMFITLFIFSKLWAKSFEEFAFHVKTMQMRLTEYVRTIRVIKAFSKEETKTEETMQSVKNYITWATKAMKSVSFPMGLITIFMEGGIVLMMIYGSLLLKRGNLTPANFILALILGTAFTQSIAKSATFQHFNAVFNQAVSGIASVLGVECEEKCEKVKNVSAGDIVFKDVCFSYTKEKPFLQNISLTFKAGTKNALLGSSGCGKTTLSNLIMGFWKADSGEILIGENNAGDLTEAQTASLISIVQQDVFLFNMSIEENIKIGKPDASHSEIVEAAKKAHIHEFIESLPEKYGTLCGEAGVKFSGGEKQRISIARAFLKNAPILILDEAVSAVDAENAFLIKQSIDELAKNKTLISIAHNLKQIENFDNIVVMENGKPAGIGTHTELLKTCALYRKMTEAQGSADKWQINNFAAK